MGGGLTATLIVNRQVDVVVVEVAESDAFLFIARKKSGRTVDFRILGKGVMGTMGSMVSLQRASDVLPFFRL